MKVIVVVVARVDLTDEGIPEQDQTPDFVATYLKDAYGGVADFLANHESTVRLTVHCGSGSRAVGWKP